MLMETGEKIFCQSLDTGTCKQSGNISTPVTVMINHVFNAFSTVQLHMIFHIFTLHLYMYSSPSTGILHV